MKFLFASSVLPRLHRCISKVWNVRAIVFCSVHRGFLFALEVCQLGLCFQMPDYNIGTVFRVRFDTVVVLFGFSFYPLSWTNCTFAALHKGFFFFYVKKYCPWNLKTWGLLKLLKLLLKWVKQKIQFAIYFHRKMRLFLIVWYLFQSRFWFEEFLLLYLRSCAVSKLASLLFIVSECNGNIAFVSI